MYQLFVSAETDITSQIPDSDLEKRTVAISYRLPNTDSVTELIIGVTVSATGVAIVIITVSISIGILCYKKKVKKIEKNMEAKSIELQAAVPPQPLQSNPSYGPIWDTPLDTEDAYEYAHYYEIIDDVREQTEVWNQTQTLEEVTGDLVPSMEAETGVTVQPNVAYGPLVESGTTSPPQFQLNPSYGPVLSAQQQADSTGDPNDFQT